jgi:hypothetical protein
MTTYIVKFGTARAWYDEESHENTRIKTFTNKKLAWKYLKRLNKFNFQGFYLLPAWTDLIKKERS